MDCGELFQKMTTKNLSSEFAHRDLNQGGMVGKLRNGVSDVVA